MKLRTAQEALDAIDGELARRIKEIGNLRSAVDESRKSFETNVARSSFLLVYAHWEGGVKNCAMYYLDYVARQRHSYEELKTNFVTIACANAIQDAASSGKLYQYAQVVDFLIYNKEERFQRSKLFEIRTESNLSSVVMDSICFNVGIQLGDDFELSRNFIDRNLLKTRNSIAHGSLEPVDKQYLSEAAERVLSLLGAFKNELQNAIVQKAYLRA